MYEIWNRYNEEQASFNDVDALGLFMDNHDNERFLSKFPENLSGFKSAITFTLTARGIPFFY